MRLSLKGSGHSMEREREMGLYAVVDRQLFNFKGV